MSLVGFRGKNHPQQVAVAGARLSVDDRATPPELFGPLHERFGFTLDACASPHNAKLPRYRSIEDDGLTTDWTGERVWCNPPYSNIRPWVEKAANSDAELVVMLLPANRTEQGWWQDLIEPVRDRGGRCRVEFIRNRQRFIRADRSEIVPNERPPFGVCLVIFAPPGSLTDARLRLADAAEAWLKAMRLGYGRVEYDALKEAGAVVAALRTARGA